MTFTEAAAQVLRLVGKPLHYKEITDVAIEKDLLSHVGKSPDVTMGARLAALVKKGDKENPLVRVKPGVFALREWDQSTIDKGLADRTPALKRLEALAAEQEGGPSKSNGAEPAIETAAEASAPEPSSPSQPEVALDEEELAEVDSELRARAELAAGATQLFAAEEDDDEPILGASDDEDEGERSDEGAGGRRRRRRRKRRGSNGGDDLPTYTVSDAPVTEVLSSDGDSGSSSSSSGGEKGGALASPSQNQNDEGGEDLIGLALADQIAGLMRGAERGGGVSLRQLSDMARRRLRLGVDGGQPQGLILAAMRTDNARRSSRGERPRFRLSGARAALTDWSLDGETRRLERDLDNVIGRLREAGRKNLLKKLTDLPHRAFAELVIVLLERAGVTELSPVKLRGSAPGEVHFIGRLKSAATDLRVAIVVRREGRDVGRERVNELRGNLHHYGGATAGWILTTGQVLSGAREESTLAGAAPVRLVDGTELARLCEQHGVGVVPVRLEVNFPDVELFEGLRGG